MTGRISRRRLLAATAALTAGSRVPLRRLLAAAGDMPRRPLGSTGRTVSLLGLGGYHVGLDALTDKEAIALVRAAIDGGITFIDNAHEYCGGRSEDRVGRALAGSVRDGVFLMTKNCAHGRDRAGSMRSLEDSLRALRTDHLDLWLFHEVIYEDDPERIFSRGGIDVALEAVRQGKVRHVGFSGHKRPAILLDLLGRPFAWDAVMMPLNLVDAQGSGFQKEVLPELNRRKIGAIAMKSQGGDASPFSGPGKIDPADCLRYVMGLPISVVVSGMPSLEILRANLAVAQRFRPLDDVRRVQLLAQAATFAGNAHAEVYKATDRFDSGLGKTAHAAGQ